MVKALEGQRFPAQLEIRSRSNLPGTQSPLHSILLTKQQADPRRLQRDPSDHLPTHTRLQHHYLETNGVARNAFRVGPTL